MNSAKYIKEKGYLPSSVMSIVYTTNESDNLKDQYQLWHVEFIPEEAEKNNVYILFRLKKSLFESESIKSPWNYIDIISLNEQPRRMKARPERENYQYEIDLDILYDQFQSSVQNYMISNEFDDEFKDEKIKTAIYDIGSWLMKTKNQRKKINLSNFQIQNPNINTFQIDNNFYDELYIFEFKLLIFHFLSLAPEAIGVEGLSNTNFSNIIENFSDINVALNYLRNTEANFEDVFIPTLDRKRDVSVSDILLPLYVCLTSDIKNNAEFIDVLEKIGISEKIWKESYDKFEKEFDIKLNNKFNLNFKKNKYVYEFISLLVETKLEYIEDGGKQIQRKMDIGNIQVWFSILRQDYLERSSEAVLRLSKKGKNFLIKTT